MPFTPAHVAVVIPLIGSPRVRKVLDPWALGVGAMVPDLPMFLPYLSNYSRWHSPAGVVTDDVAAVFVLLALLQFVLRDPLTALLPPRLAARVAALPGPAWRRFPAIALGAAAGAATHVLWDSFTHEWGAALWGWAWMTAPVVGWLNGAQVAQYASSVLGLALTVWWVLRYLRAARNAPRPEAPGLGPVGVRPRHTGRAGVEGRPELTARAEVEGRPELTARAEVEGRPELTARARWGVLTGAAGGACCAAALWTFVDPPNPQYGWAGVLAKTGVGLVVGLCAVLTVYALLWQLARVIRLTRA
ncbi:DUF4184 family protein [Sphaerisporangium sp. NPDC005288]|uniref:DUF4184 family protein n=1 Tax=Sphaerisporangium sp. NPDC005288 TaxID=3155114 RepID=UPI0033B1C12C